MTNEEYKKLIKRHIPKENRLKNVLIAFIIGGLMGIISQGMTDLIAYFFMVTKTEASSISCLIIIFLSSLFTALGFFDKWVGFGKCGLLIPTTGFAHSTASSALEYRSDGMITGLGANFFKLAGSVILFSIVASFILCVIRVIIWL